MSRPIVIVTVLLVAAVFFGTYQAFVQNSPPVPEPGPEIRSSTVNLQDLTDKAAQAALDEEWLLCQYYTQQLLAEWDRLKPNSPNRLSAVMEIDQILFELDDLVLNQNQTGVISATTRLTHAFAYLFNS
jgi:hypothetical protein